MHEFSKLKKSLNGFKNSHFQRELLLLFRWTYLQDYEKLHNELKNCTLKDKTQPTPVAITLFLFIFIVIVCLGSVI